MRQIRFAKNGYILISILFYLSGIICIVTPDINESTATIAGGLILIVYGIIKIVGYLSKDLYCLAFQYNFACGLLLIVIGVVVLVTSRDFKEDLLTELGILVLLDSLLSIQTSVDAKRFGLAAWPVILASSILSGTLGVVLIVADTQIAAGFSLLAEGFMRHYIVRCTVYLSPKRNVPFPDNEYEETKDE